MTDSTVLAFPHLQIQVQRHDDDHCSRNTQEPSCPRCPVTAFTPGHHETRCIHRLTWVARHGHWKEQAADQRWRWLITSFGLSSTTLLPNMTVSQPQSCHALQLTQTHGCRTLWLDKFSFSPMWLTLPDWLDWDSHAIDVVIRSISI